jgi:hypothetical protein
MRLLFDKLEDLILVTIAVGIGLALCFPDATLEFIDVVSPEGFIRNIAEAKASVGEEEPLLPQGHFKKLGRREAKELWLGIASQCVPTTIAEAMAVRESGWRQDATRFENSWYNEHCARITNSEHRRTCATSVGIGQIGYGLWGKTCGWDSFLDGFDVEENAKCFCHVMSTNRERIGAMSTPSKIKAWITAYNGSGAQARKYGEQVYAQVSAEIINRELINFKGES